MEFITKNTFFTNRFVGAISAKPCFLSIIIIHQIQKMTESTIKGTVTSFSRLTKEKVKFMTSKLTINVIQRALKRHVIRWANQEHAKRD